MDPEGAFQDPMATPVLIDSHCHIVFRTFEEDLEAVAERWRGAGVTSLLHACIPPTLRNGLEILFEGSEDDVTVTVD